MLEPPRADVREGCREVSRHHARLPVAVNPMLNRSVVVIGHEPAFYGWLKTTGITDEQIAERLVFADRMAYLIPACHFPEESEEVVEDLFEEIFRRELQAWQPDAKFWPDTADFDLFTRWFTVDSVSCVDDVGRGDVGPERLP